MLSDRLWDHLAANISLYVEPCADEAIKLKPSSAAKLDRAESKSRHNREWKGLARDASDPPPLRSSDIEIHRRSRERVRHSRRSPSPRRDEDKKRSRVEDRQENKVFNPFLFFIFLCFLVAHCLTFTLDNSKERSYDIGVRKT